MRLFARTIKGAFELLPNLKTCLAVTAVVAGIASRPAAAGIITTPVSLAPGSQYRLVFVTADTYTATDSNIADYNAEVSLEANSVTALQGLNTSWSVIGSTASVDAITNIGSDPTVPIYNLLGTMVADDATGNSGGLFTGSILSKINSDENGVAPRTAFAWTGSNGGGVAFDAGLGALGSSTGTEYGGINFTNLAWILDGSSGSNNSLDLYAISGELTVGGSSTPEPTTTATMIMGMAFLYLAARRRHRIRRAD